MTDRLENPESVDQAALTAEVPAEVVANIQQIVDGVAEKATGWGNRTDQGVKPKSIGRLDTGLIGNFSDKDWETVGSHE